jgi:hypothetical protein
MAFTLLDMSQRALRERAQFSVPASIVGNSDPTAVRLLAVADRTGNFLFTEHIWQDLIQTYTFSTANGTSTYALPSGFDRFLQLTFWDRTNRRYVKGPVSAADWEMMRSGILSAASQIQSFFRVSANLFEIYPTPTTVRTIAYQYLTKYWIVANGDSTATKEYFTADNDTTIFRDNLMVMGIKERLEAVAQGVDFAPSAEYQAFLAAGVAADGGKDAITFGPPRFTQSVLGGGNIPDFNYG